MVLGQDGKVVLLRHGNVLLKVHVSKVIDTNYVMKADEVIEENSENEDNIDKNVDISRVEIDEEREKVAIKNKMSLPKIGDRVSYLPVGSTEWKHGTIKSYAGKRTTSSIGAT